LDFFTIYSAFNTLLLSKLLYPGFTNLQALSQTFSEKVWSKTGMEAWSTGATVSACLLDLRTLSQTLRRDRPMRQSRHSGWAQESLY